MFKQLVALVTGGAGGLGQATLQRLVNKGAKVVICDLPTSNGSEVAAELGENASYIPADVRSEQDIENVMSEISNKHGRLDVLVNCAGLCNAFITYNFNSNRPRALEDFQNVIMTNVLGTINVTRQAAGLIGKNQPDEDGLRGVIINTAGTEAFRGTSGQTSTAAASGAIHSITRPIAADLSEAGIRVLTVAPGLIKTKICDQFPTAHEAFISSECILAPNRFGYPDEFARVVEMIIANPYLNATTIDISAGLHINVTTDNMSGKENRQSAKQSEIKTGNTELLHNRF